MEFIIMYTMLLHDHDIKVTKNFTSKELMCRCSYKDCNHSYMFYKTVDSAQRFRNFMKESLYITSAYRCQRHNEDVGGHIDSYHKKGHAIDFAVPQDYDIDYFADKARMFFDVVIKYPNRNFIHCHNL